MCIINLFIFFLMFNRAAEEQIKPMIILLEKLKIDIRDELEMMDYCKANIMRNKDHVNYLVSERFTLKK